MKVRPHPQDRRSTWHRNRWRINGRMTANRTRSPSTGRRRLARLPQTPRHRRPATGEIIGRYAVGGREEASEDRTTADDRPNEPSGGIAGDAYGALIADQD